MEGWKLCANRGPLCTLKNFQWCARTCYAGAAILRGRCLSLIPRRDELKSLLKSKVKVKVTLRLTVSQSVSKSWCQAPSGAHDQIFITVWQLRSCFCGAPSLTRRQVCLSYMLLALASAVFPGSESLRTRDHILLSQIWDFPFLRLLQLAGSQWRYWTQPPQGPQHRKHICCLAMDICEPHRKHILRHWFYCCIYSVVA
jgi:hypothetical protein